MIDQLIKVTFEDATDHDTLTQGQDIVGIPFDHYWGPANEVKILDRSSFLNLYPECLPLGKNYASAQPFMFSYANAKKCLDFGATTLEAVRILPSDKEIYWGVKVAQVITSDVVKFNGYNYLGTIESDNLKVSNKVGWFKKTSIDGTTGLDAAEFSIVLKYSGLIPSSFGYDKFLLHIKTSGNNEIVSDVAPIVVEVIGVSGEQVNKTYVQEFSGDQYNEAKEKYKDSTTVNDDGTTITVKVSDELNVLFTVTTTIKGFAETSRKVVESWEGSLDKLSVVDGKSFYIGNVLKNSNWVQAYDVSKDTVILPATDYYCEYDSTQAHWSDGYATKFTGSIALSPGGISDQSEYTNAFVQAYQQSFTDMEASQATVLAPALPVREIYETIQEIAQQKNYLIAVVGLPQNNFEYYELGDSVEVGNKSLKQYVKDYKNNLIQDKFSTLIVGSEVATVFKAYKIVQDCTAGFIGRTIAIADQVKLNQPASAKQYGDYKNGSNTASLKSAFSFDTVLELHNEGIGSIFNAATGPRIWNVRTLHPRKTSYFSKLNVMRVCASITRAVMELAVNALHTPTVSDPSLLSDFDTKTNSIIGLYASAGNIKSDSWADVSSSLNNDTDTNGGEILLIELHIFFMKVVEEVHIKIIASDSRVTAELS